MKDCQDSLTLDGEGPVYAQIKRCLQDKIRSGEWQPGHRLPPEEALALHFQAARMTVNRAFRELVEDGLIIRRRRLGSFVAEPATPAAILQIVDMAQEIPARGQTYTYELLSSEIVPADEAIASAMHTVPGRRLLHITCRHSADGAPVELEDRWINLNLLPEAANRDFSDTPPGSWLLSVVPWTEAEHTVFAANARPDIAEKLDIEPGAACLVLDRRTFQDDQVVTRAVLTHPGDRHRMTERFSPR